jgi:predicted  nucleic acid-binding Zn-ribbon protein
MDLTKDYFDDRMATFRADIADMRRDIIEMKHDIVEIKATMATKDDLNDLRTEMNAKFEAVFELLDVREQVAQHERDIQELKRALKLA